MKYVIYIYLDFEVVVFKLRSTRGSICSLCAQQGEARELQILPQVLSNLNTTTKKSKYLYNYHLNFQSKQAYFVIRTHPPGIQLYIIIFMIMRMMMYNCIPGGWVRITKYAQFVYTYKVILIHNMYSYDIMQQYIVYYSIFSYYNLQRGKIEKKKKISPMGCKWSTEIQMKRKMF